MWFFLPWVLPHRLQLNHPSNGSSKTIKDAFTLMEQIYFWFSTLSMSALTLPCAPPSGSESLQSMTQQFLLISLTFSETLQSCRQFRTYLQLKLRVLRERERPGSSDPFMTRVGQTPTWRCRVMTSSTNSYDSQLKCRPERVRFIYRSGTWHRTPVAPAQPGGRVLPVTVYTTPEWGQTEEAWLQPSCHSLYWTPGGVFGIFQAWKRLRTRSDETGSSVTLQSAEELLPADLWVLQHIFLLFLNIKIR